LLATTHYQTDEMYIQKKKVNKDINAFQMRKWIHMFGIQAIQQDEHGFVGVDAFGKGLH